MKILVWKDWGSSPLWVPGRSSGWASCDLQNFDLSQELVERLNYLSDWYEIYLPGSDEPEPDWDSYNAYKHALAIDIKRHFKESARVFIHKGNEIFEIQSVFSGMTRSSL